MNLKMKSLSLLYNGRRPGIKDGIGLQQGSNVKLNAPKNCLTLLRAKLPWFRIYNDGYILYPTNYHEHKIRRIHARKSHSVSHHAFMYKNETSNSRHTTILNCLERKFLLHQMSILFHLRLLMLHMCLLTNQAK